MNRRRKILVNDYEVAVRALLHEAAADSSAEVFAKVGIKDALNINRSGLTSEEYFYAMKAHFDFVVAREGTKAAFAVEFDGPTHDTDPETIHRDNLKNRICQKLGMPLLRIDSGFLRPVADSIILGWLVEIWFMSEAFEREQAAGRIPPDEDFDYNAIFGFARIENNRLVEIDTSRGADMMEWFVKAAAGEVVITNPANPFYAAEMFIYNHCFRVKTCSRVDSLSGFHLDAQGRHIALEVLKLPNNRLIIGVGRCKSFNFPPVFPWDLARELAVLDASELLQAHLKGQQVALPLSAHDDWLQRVKPWTGHL